MEKGKSQNITKFLLQSVLFYENIDDHVKLLDLDSEELSLFKNDIRIFLFVAERYQSFTRSFVLYNISTIQKRYEHLSTACINSKNYTNAMGAKLGILEAEKTEPAFSIPAETLSINRLAS